VKNAVRRRVALFFSRAPGHTHPALYASIDAVLGCRQLENAPEASWGRKPYSILSVLADELLI
jgi:hypothetical protein